MYSSFSFSARTCCICSAPSWRCGERERERGETFHLNTHTPLGERVGKNNNNISMHSVHKGEGIPAKYNVYVFFTHAPSERSMGQQMDFFFSFSTPPNLSAATN